VARRAQPTQPGADALRPTRNHHGHPTRAVAGVILTLAALVAAAAPLAADPAQDADATVAALRAQADAAAQSYLDALTQSQALQAQVADLEAKLPVLATQRRQLQVAAERRAVAAYKRSGSAQLATIIASDDALQAARRTVWLEHLNARDNQTFRQLVTVSAQLEAQRAALHDAQQHQQAAIDQLQAQGQDIDAKLQAAEDRRRSLAAQPPRPVAPKAAAGGAPPGPPPDYVPTPGAHPHHDDPFLVCTRAHEGTYTSYNPAGPYMGAYQFLQSTWNSTANGAGRPELIGVPPHTASEYDQDDVAWALYQRSGKGAWGGRC
jgi:septal ring factor EnvC (AmiA/AmiB activator)